MDKRYPGPRGFSRLLLAASRLFRAQLSHAEKNQENLWDQGGVKDPNEHSTVWQLSESLSEVLLSGIEDSSRSDLEFRIMTIQYEEMIDTTYIQLFFDKL